MKKVCILGAGSWGTALATLLANNSLQVSLWGRLEDGIDEMKQLRENKRYLPGVKLPALVYPESDVKEAIKDAILIVVAVPSQAVREVLTNIKPLLNEDTYLVNAAKGLEISSGMRMSQVFADVLGKELISKNFAVLSGPSHAEEVARNIPTAITLAAFNMETAFNIQDLFMAPMFRVYTNHDVAGVELGGSLKNIVALASGMLYGLGYGDNSNAALITRGLVEIMRMGEALGGDPRTFTGLSGLGDLIVTCASRHSRNRRAGELLGQGKSLAETMEIVGMVIEGVNATRIIHKLAEDLGVDMPICKACYRVLFAGVDPRIEATALMVRKPKREIEVIFGQ